MSIRTGDTDPVADRGPGLGLEQGDRLADLVAVGGRRDQRLGLGAERDEADPELLRQAVEERPHRVDRGVEPGRLDVVRAHRAGDVDEQHDRRVLVGLREPEPRMGDGPCGEDERQQEKGERHEPAPPAAAGGDDRGEHGEVREGDRVAGAAAVGDDREDDHERHREQQQQEKGRAERHQAAHLTPSCTSAPAAGGSASLAVTAICTRAPTIRRLHADRASERRRRRLRRREGGRAPAVDERLTRGARKRDHVLEARIRAGRP